MRIDMIRWYRDIEDLLRNGVSEENRLFASRYARKARHFIDRTMKGLDQEALETREMAGSFFRLLEHKLRLNERTEPPGKEEVKAALEQLKDVGRFSVFATAVILPGGVVSLVGLELLARKYGVNFSFIPSSFRRDSVHTGDKKDPEGKREDPDEAFPNNLREPSSGR